MGEKLGGDGCDDDGSGAISAQNYKTDFGNDSEEGKWRGMVLGLGGISAGHNRDLYNKGVHEEEAGKNGEICSRDTNIQTLYSIREDGDL